MARDALDVLDNDFAPVQAAVKRDVDARYEAGVPIASSNGGRTYVEQKGKPTSIIGKYKPALGANARTRVCGAA